MYNEKIEELIESALIDGVLTEKEKQVLFKKAESMGIDLDEFEMVLNARLFVKQKSEQKETAAPKSNKLGDVRKCPSCGAIAETFSTKCAECSTEFRNIEASQNIIRFFEKLDEIESHRKESIYETDKRYSNNDSDVGAVLKRIILFPILIPQKIFSFFINKSKPAKWSTTDSRKEELILNFPVPASREEILEFLNLASSKINSVTYFNAFSEETKYKDAWTKIWLRKIEQIHSKAAMAMKNDKESFNDVNEMTKSARLLVKKNNHKVLHIAIGFTLLIAALVIWIVVSVKSYAEEAKKERERLEKIQEEYKSQINDYINSGKYGEAEKIIPELTDERSVVAYKSDIQLAKLIKKLDEAEKNFDNSKLRKTKKNRKLMGELKKIVWDDINNKSDLENIETKRSQKFTDKKTDLEKKLKRK